VQDRAERAAGPLGTAEGAAHNLTMRSSRHLAWLNVANGIVILALMWHWSYYYSRHTLLDAATLWTLAFGFLVSSIDKLRCLRHARQNKTDGNRRDLLLFPAEGQDAAEASPAVSDVTGDRVAWFTILTHAPLMIALSWRWAFQYDPYTIFGAVTLSTLMLGFSRASLIVVASLGRPGRMLDSRGNAEQDALLFFPAEDSRPTDLMLEPRRLATRRKALL
jgi:hypothetical protein